MKKPALCPCLLLAKGRGLFFGTVNERAQAGKMIGSKLRMPEKQLFRLSMTMHEQLENYITHYVNPLYHVECGTCKFWADRTVERQLAIIALQSETIQRLKRQKGKIRCKMKRKPVPRKIKCTIKQNRVPPGGTGHA